MSDEAITRAFRALLAIGFGLALLIIANGFYIIVHSGFFEGDRLHHGLVVRGVGVVGLIHSVAFYFFALKRRRPASAIIPLYVVTLALSYLASLVGLEAFWKGEGAGFILAATLGVGLLSLLAILVGSRPYHRQQM